MSFCAARVLSAALDQDVENEAVLINGAPEPVLFAGDRDDNLIHMPFVPASRRALADPIGEHLAEFLSPLAHGLVCAQIRRAASISSTMRKLQGKPEIQPNRIADHLWRKAMAAIERITGCRHDPRLLDPPFPIR